MIIRTEETKGVENSLEAFLRKTVHEGERENGIFDGPSLGHRRLPGCGGRLFLQTRGKKMVSAQTNTTKKYQDKVGLIAKSFKIKKDLADEFKDACDACDRVGVGQAATISRLMREFIDEVNSAEDPES